MPWQMKMIRDDGNESEWMDCVEGTSYVVIASDCPAKILCRRKPKRTDAEIVAKIRELVAPHPGREGKFAEYINYLYRISKGDF